MGSPEPTPPRQRIPAKEQEHCAPVYQDEEPETSYHNVRMWRGNSFTRMKTSTKAERKLKDSPHVTDEVLQTQLLNALSGEARDMVSSLPADVSSSGNHGWKPGVSAAGARSITHYSKRLLCDPPRTVKSSRDSTTGLASSQRTGASQPQGTFQVCFSFQVSIWIHVYRLQVSFFIILCKRSSLFQILQVCFSFHVSIWIHVYCFRFETLEPKLYPPGDSKPQPSLHQSSSLSSVLRWVGWKFLVFSGN